MLYTLLTNLYHRARDWWLRRPTIGVMSERWQTTTKELYEDQHQ